MPTSPCITRADRAANPAAWLVVGENAPALWVRCSVVVHDDAAVTGLEGSPLQRTRRLIAKRNVRNIAV